MKTLGWVMIGIAALLALTGTIRMAAALRFGSYTITQFIPFMMPTAAVVSLVGIAGILLIIYGRKSH